MNEELKVFENRSDDWLAKERRYEESVSAWDLDEGKKLKESHERNHSHYDKTHGKGVIGTNYINKTVNKNDNFVKVDAKKLGKFYLKFVIVIAIIIVFGYLIDEKKIVFDEMFAAFPIIIFVLAFSFITGGKKKWILYY